MLRSIFSKSAIMGGLMVATNSFAEENVEIRHMIIDGIVYNELTSQPIGSYENCKVSDCTPEDKSNGEKPSLKELKHANRGINFFIRAESDQKIYGKGEVWINPIPEYEKTAIHHTSGEKFFPFLPQGDCEDYVLAKIDLFNQMGVPLKDMFLIVVRRKLSGEGHLILGVLHEDNIHYFDNRHARVSKVLNKDYTFLKYANAGDRGKWFSLQDSNLLTSSVDFILKNIPSGAAVPNP